MTKASPRKNKKTGTEQRRTDTPVPRRKFQAIGTFLRAPEVALTTFLTVFAFVGITWCFPFPATLTDSAQYVNQAAEKVIGAFRPFGYSWFIMKIHAVSTSVRALTAAQLLLQVASLIYFIRATFHFFPALSRPYRLILIGALSLNPVALYLSNTILSDSLFTSLTLFWLASGMCLLQRRDWLLALFHLLVMYMAMKVRYAGIIYPAVSALVFLSAKGNRRLRAAIALAPVLIGIFFYFSTQNMMFKKFGVNTFSGFAGWQAANNAMHILPYTEIQARDIPDPEVRTIFEFVQLFGDTIYPPPGQTTTAFMWEDAKPLKQYFFQKIRPERPAWKYMDIWLYAGTKYQRFGDYFIRKYPLLYARYFFLPNVRDVIYPPLGVLTKHQGVAPDNVCRTWFEIPGTVDTNARYPLFERHINNWLRMANMIVYILSFLLLFIAIITWRRRFFDGAQGRILAFWAGFICVFIAFNAYATTVEIRYLAPVSIVLVAMAISIFGYLRWPSATASGPESGAAAPITV